MRLGLIIQEYRREHSLSMDEFSKKCELSKAYIGLLEKGIHPKTGKTIIPSITTIKKAAKGMNINFDELFSKLDEDIALESVYDKSKYNNPSSSSISSHRIPVLGRVAAGIPLNAVEYIIDYEEVDDTLASLGELFGLKIKGDSMTPRICDGDVVIVKRQPVADSGDIVIASLNGDDAVCKRLMIYGKTILLRSNNPAYDDIDVTSREDFHIIGKVVELRGKL